MKNLREKQVETQLNQKMEQIKIELQLAVKMEQIQAELELAVKMQKKVDLAIQKMHKELNKLSVR